ncbi:hypothetical protein, partial [Geoglobus sp.]
MLEGKRVIQERLKLLLKSDLEGIERSSTLIPQASLTKSPTVNVKISSGLQAKSKWHIIKAGSL